MACEGIKEKCLTAQNDELEVLMSIFGDDWKCVSERTYHITLVEGGVEATLHVTLPDSYPFEEPPMFTLSAPQLSKIQKDNMRYQLDKVYLENIGQPVLFQWIDQIRECLQSGTNNNSALEEEEINTVVETELETPEVVQISEIHHGDIITDRKSTFQGHAASVFSVEQVKQVLSVLKENKKICNATHNMFAYRISREDGSSYIQDCEDDGETQAGSRMLHLLQILDVNNVLVVVSRWYGGVHLGSERFRHINNATRQVLLKASFITNESKKK